ncbi:MAG: hypothetical protein ABIU58_00950 [Ramlibacter sp.]
MTDPKKPDSKPPQRFADTYYPGDPIPVPDTLEKDTDTTWAMFQEVADKESHRYADTAPMAKPGEISPLPPAAPRSAGASLQDKLLAELKKQNRVCPKPELWEKFFEELVQGKRHVEIKALPTPMTGAAWNATSSLAKRMTIKDQIAWAASNGRADAAYKFLTHLAESDWFHIGDPTP